VHMVNASKSMRSYLQGSGGPLMQFSSISVDKNDNGDGGGIPVFTFWSIPAFGMIVSEVFGHKNCIYYLCLTNIYIYIYIYYNLVTTPMSRLCHVNCQIKQEKTVT